MDTAGKDVCGVYVCLVRESVCAPVCVFGCLFVYVLSVCVFEGDMGVCVECVWCVRRGTWVR